MSNASLKSFKMSEFKVEENLQTETSEHELRVKGHYLSEKTQFTLIRTENSEPILSTLKIKMRVIDSNYVKEIEIFQEGQEDSQLSIETDMTNEDRKIFDENWAAMWKPKISFVDGQILPPFSC